jgi:hypothetical protein
MKRVRVAAVLCGVVIVASSAASSWASGLIPESDAARFGLTRAWFHQAEVDPARGKVQSLVLDEGVLFVQTDQGKIDAVNANTGERLWVTQVGEPGRITTQPAVSHKYVAAINGSTVYVLNRVTGKILWSASLPGAPGAGPCLSQQHVHIPLVNGRVIAYRLTPAVDPMADVKKVPEDAGAKPAAQVDLRESLRLRQDKTPPIGCISPGRVLTTPLVLRQNPGAEIIAWTTDKGLLCVGKVDRNSQQSFDLLYTVRTDKPIVCSPAYVPPADPDASSVGGMIFAGSQDGYLYAIYEGTGDVAWRFPTGSPILESPVALGPFVFVTNEAGNLFCLNAKDGTEKWAGPAPNVARFLAASRGRIYAADATGQVHVLDARLGTRLATVPLEASPLKLTNVESDRLFVATPTGTVQCLHESELIQPLTRRFAEAKDPDLIPVDPTKVAKKEPPTVGAVASSSPSVPRSTTPKSTTPKSTTPKTTKKERTGKKGSDIFGGGPFEQQVGGKNKGGGKNKRGGMGPGGSAPAGLGMPGMPGGNQ